MTGSRAFDALLLWVALMGLYPLADPGHHGSSPLVAVDLALHMAAVVALAARWTVARRA